MYCRTKLIGQDNQNMTHKDHKELGTRCWGRTAARTGQPENTVEMAQAGQEREDKMARTSQMERAAGTGQLR
jgi:hypothetical protein